MRPLETTDCAKCGFGGSHDHAEGFGVDHLGARDLPGPTDRGRPDRRIAHTVPVEFHRGGIERRAVGERQTGPQGQQERGSPPVGGGEPGGHLVLDVEGVDVVDHQRAVQRIAQHRLMRPRVGQRGRVQGARFPGLQDDEVAAGHRITGLDPAGGSLVVLRAAGPEQ